MPPAVPTASVESDSQFNVSRTPHVFQQPANGDRQRGARHDRETQAALRHEEGTQQRTRDHAGAAPGREALTAGLWSFFMGHVVSALADGSPDDRDFQVNRYADLNNRAYSKLHGGTFSLLFDRDILFMNPLISQPSVGWYRCAMRRRIYSHTVTLICTWPTLCTNLTFHTYAPHNATILHVSLQRDKMDTIVGQGTTRCFVALTRKQGICGNNGEGRMQAAMDKRKRHSRVEIATKLAQANDLAMQGKLQSEIARTLGVSVMTLHRWRKAPPRPQPAHEVGQPDWPHTQRDPIAELQLENSRLRQLVTDLLLEKIKLEEAAKLPA